MIKVDFGELTPVRFSEQIAARIEALIISRELRTGDKLPAERELAESFGVSRPAVREALKLLGERGLVQSRMGHGTFIVDPGLNGVVSSIAVASRMRNTTLGHLNEARYNLEVPCAGWAAERATPADVDKMQAAVEAMETNLHDLPKYMQADLEFHAAIAAATQNPIFVILNHSIIDLVQHMRALLTTPEEAALGQLTHRRLVECIGSQNAAGAREAMQEHLEHVARLGRESNLL
jgi:GntR family transcriptional regulator, transcriptional repressor for pyruvate dehydrogenase complex